jgi:predicted RNA-binding Zn ribbon-like protein
MTGQWLTPADGTRWYYDSGSVSLDFAHTGALDPTAGTEQLHSPADLGRWLAERVDRLDPASTERELADALLLREAITRVARGFAHHNAPGADDVDTINLYAATPDIPPALAGGRRQAGAGRLRVGQALSSIARDAVGVFTREAGESRIRECAADDCELVFVDESRTGSRRWCSMQRCGNRAKVRAHRARAQA